MKVVRTREYIRAFREIMRFIANDKKSAAQNFKRELDLKINDMADNPKMYRKSLYFSDESYRDMIHKGYTVIYKIANDEIRILDIFKWQEKQ